MTNKWNKLKIKDFANASSERNQGDNELPVVSVTKYKGIVPSLEYFKKQVYSKDLSNYKVIKRNQFAYATIHLDEGSIGILDLYDKALLSPMYTVFEVDESKASINYLYALLKSNELLNVYQRLGLGSVDRRKSISFADFGNITITLPPISIQHKIGDILSSIDEAIQKTDQIIQKSEELKNGLMNELLTKGIGNKKFKKTKLGEIPEKWRIISLDEIVEKLEAGVSVNSEDKQIIENEFGILKTSAVTYGFFDPRQHKKIIDKDLSRARVQPLIDRVIISRMNTPLLVGASAYVDKDYNNLFLPDRLWQIELNSNSNVSAKWLSYQFAWLPTLSRIRELASGTSASMKNISKQKLLTLEIAIPPYQEQIRITEILQSVDSKNKTEKIQMNALKRIKDGLMHDIFHQKVQIN